MVANINTTVTLFVTSDAAQSERRFDRLQTIGDVKDRLGPITGVPLSSMALQLFSQSNKLVAVLDNDALLLGSFQVSDFMRIHVTNTNPTSNKAEYTDVSAVEKFEITADEYNQRTDTVRAFKQRNKMGRFKDVSEQEQFDIDNEFEQEALLIKVGVRCMANEGQQKRGEVVFVGKTEFKNGFWVGVKYDEPVGKHDGMVAGKRYFECQKKHGAFLRPNNIMIGDYPEEDLFGDDDDLDEM